MSKTKSKKLNLDKYRFFYKNSDYLGASKILKDFLSIDQNIVIPASVSHGVDFYHTHFAQDIDAIEPIHWSCRDDIDKVKPFFVAPHPWTMNLSQSKYQSNSSGSLIIGPPPSPENDHNLLKLLKKHSLLDSDILVKPKGNYLSSIKFWNDNGIQTRSAGSADENFYNRLLEILSNYKNIICPTLSSALFFAASIRKNIIVIPEYTYRVYENMNYLQEADGNSKKSQAIIETIVSGNAREISELSQFLLGFDYLAKKDKIKDEVLSLIANLEHPFQKYENNKIPYLIREFLTIITSKQKIMRMDLKDYFELFLKGHVGIMTMSEFDFRLNGVNKHNFNLERVKFIPGKTEPGFGYQQYLN